MAKTIIREYDNSVTTLPSYSNFSVVVPGYVANANKYAEVADTFGIYECNSLTDFETYIGATPGVPVAAVAPEREVLNEEGTGEAKYITKLDWKLASTYFNAGELYAVKNRAESGNVGYLVDETHKYVLVDSSNDIELEQDETTGETITVDSYARIKTANRGKNAVVGDQMGSQIAYELIKLGYTVVYKKINAAASELEKTEFWSPLKDKRNYQFRYVTTGGYYSSEAMNRIAELATAGNAESRSNPTTIQIAGTIKDTNGRGDIIALCDIDEGTETNSKIDTSSQLKLIKSTFRAAAQISSADKYSAIFCPRVIYDFNDKRTKDFGGNTIFPASFHYLACAAYVHSQYAEWYAVAGYNKGISRLPIIGTTITYGDVANNTLSPRSALEVDDLTINKAVNLIVTERGSAYYLWGNRTAEVIGDELKWSNFLNVRQLCATLKKQMQYASDQYRFDPNSDLLWLKFTGTVDPLLDRMESDQGIKGKAWHRVLDPNKGVVNAKLRIVPIEAAEDFDLSIYLENDLTTLSFEESDVE